MVTENENTLQTIRDYECYRNLAWSFCECYQYHAYRVHYLNIIEMCNNKIAELRAIVGDSPKTTRQDFEELTIRWQNEC